MIILGSIGLYVLGILVTYLMMFNGPTFSFFLQVQKPNFGHLLADFRLIVGLYLIGFFVGLVMRYVFGVADSYLGQVQGTALTLSILLVGLTAIIGEFSLIPMFGWILGPAANWFAVGNAWRMVGAGC